MNNEEFYDAEIAPVLADLATKCGDRGMSFLAAVEYDPGLVAETWRQAPDAGLAMLMLHHCCKSGTNIDAYLIGVIRYLKENGIDYSSSLFLKLNERGPS